MNIYKITYCEQEDAVEFRGEISGSELIKRYDEQLFWIRAVSKKLNESRNVYASKIYQAYVIANNEQHAETALFLSEVCFCENPVSIEIRLVSPGVLCYDYDEFSIHQDGWLEAK